MDRFLDRLPPGAQHAVIALAIQMVSVLVLAVAYTIMPVPVFLLAAGGLCALGYSLGRARTQAEIAAGSDRIPITQILPRSLREVGWPALAVTLCWVLLWIGGH